MNLDEEVLLVQEIRNKAADFGDAVQDAINDAHPDPIDSDGLEDIEEARNTLSGAIDNYIGLYNG